MTLGAQRENKSTMRFAAECKKRWHMDSQESKQYWDECFSDPTVPKGLSDWGILILTLFKLDQQNTHILFSFCCLFTKTGVDERGHTTIAKLKRTCVRGGRQLSHNRSISQAENLKVDESSLPEMKKRSLVAQVLFLK